MTTKEQLQPAATEVPEPHVSERDADVTFGLLKQYGGGEVTQGLDRAGERRLNRKLYFILVPLLVLINLLLFVSCSSSLSSPIFQNSWQHCYLLSRGF